MNENEIENEAESGLSLDLGWSTLALGHENLKKNCDFELSSISIMKAQILRTTQKAEFQKEWTDTFSWQRLKQDKKYRLNQIKDAIYLKKNPTRSNIYR